MNGKRVSTLINCTLCRVFWLQYILCQKKKKEPVPLFLLTGAITSHLLDLGAQFLK